MTETLVSEALARLRGRLLDLSRRNVLLNYKERRQDIRIVDELPDITYTRLRDGQVFRLTPVDPPPSSQEPEDKASQYDLLRESPIAPSSSRSPTVASVAKTNTETERDLDPELPRQGSEIEDRHLDDELQTPFDPKALEIRARKIRETARAAIEETGANFLFLVVGFLEWYESEDSADQLRAPLVIVPIEIKKGKFDKKRDTFSYTVEYREEDIETNLSLLEKLKVDFGIDLPEFNEEQTPDNYLQAVSELASDIPRWRVAREMTIGLFSFSRILMYRDLDPTRWPVGKGPLHHPSATTIFGGVPEGDGNSRIGIIGEVYDQDRDDSVPDLPLVLDADSSQYSVIVDAVHEHRGLVVHGPPGTGKSQTIANLIAAAIATGQSVLFVAEKKAALDVVRRRLDSCGLGHFALELHSHKANKSQVHSDLESRIKKRFPKPRQLAEHKADLAEAKKFLTEYSDAASTLVGPDQQSYESLVWRAGRHRAEAEPIPSPISNRWSSPQSRTEINRRATQVADYARLSSSIPDDSKRAWAGINISTALPTDLQLLLDSLESVRIASLAWDRVAAEMSAQGLLGLEKACCLPILSQLPSWLSDMPRTLDGDSEEWRALSQPESRQTLRWLKEKIETYRTKQEIAQSRREIVLPTQERKLINLERACTTVESMGLASLTMPQLDHRLADHVAVRNALSTLRDAAELASSTIRREVSYLADWRDCLRIDKILTARPLDFEPDPPKVWFSEEARKAIELAIERAERIRGELQSASETFRIARLSTPERLRDSARMLSIAHSKSFTRFRREYREQKHGLDGVVLDLRNLLDPKFGDQLNTYADTLEKRELFDNDSTLRSLAGSRFQGLKTDWNAVRRDFEWMRELISAFGDRHIAREASANLEELGANAANAASQGSASVGTIEERGSDIITEPQLRTPISVLADGLIRGTEDLATALETLRECSPAIDLTPKMIRTLARAKMDCLAIEGEVEAKGGSIEPRLRPLWRGLETDAASLIESISWVEELISKGVPTEWLEWSGSLEEASLTESFQSASEVAGKLSSSLTHLEQAISGLGEFDFYKWAGSSRPGVTSAELVGAVQATLTCAQDAVSWAQLCRQRAALFDAQLDEWVSWIELVQPLPPTAESYFIAACWERLVHSATSNNPVLAGFERLSHEQRLKRFRKLDADLKKIRTEEVAAIAATRLVPRGIASGRVGDLSELALIQHELGKKKKHIPIRRLVQRAGNALQGLKPCFLMSPMSVAQYLAPGQLEFDLVVIDEASQVKPEEALGALMRANQPIIVGDPKQLPPTSFFDRSIELDTETEDLAAAEEAESILEVARESFPNRILQWHYRSEHHSLIAFSNAEFYGGDLVVFPSPHTEGGEYGIRRVFIEGAQYQASKNPAEARAVAEAVRDHLVEQRKGTVGVATFNTSQRELIAEEIERLQKNDPAFDRILREQDAESDEPLFIKNLENVQGDERDVIFISTTYGPDAQTGRVYQRFGPLNGAHGWRRLNVILTRARRRIEVYTSMRASDVLAGEGSSRGVVALHKFLEYAETGIIPDLGVSEGEPENNFELDVATVLSHRGYRVDAQIGVAGFRIDIGVRDPRGDGYILGVECDGATYHSSKSARDRDRLRQEILERKGWKIHRIWSTDWFQNRESEILRLYDRVEKANREISVSDRQ